MAADQTCQKLVHRGLKWDRHVPCGKTLRTVEQQTAGLCGTHLAGQRRADANEIARDAALSAARADTEAGRAVADRFRGLLPPALHGGVWGFGAEIRMTLPAAHGLLARLEPDDDEGEDL